MERPLQKNSQITLFSNGKPTTFTIIKSIGDGGASCVAYEVKYTEAYDDSRDFTHYGILKEYFPHFLYDTSNGFQRTEDGHIVVPPQHKEKFEKGLADFETTYSNITDFLADCDEAEKYHPTQIGLFRGNHTCYTLTSRDKGISYDKYDANDLLTTLKLMLTVTKAVEHYHSAGYLHLDIKPKNILILSDVTELVKLFDYDSLTSIADLATGNISAIPSPGYYVPELSEVDIESIGVSTDIFEIGATIYERIYGAMPECSEMEHDAVFDLDSPEMTAGMSPKIKYELNKLLKKALSINIPPEEIANDKELYRSVYKDNLSYRYISTDELKSQLKKIIALIEHNKPYLLDDRNPIDISVSDYSIHFNRNDVTKALRRMLDTNGYVCLRGGEGYGKTTILSQFVKQYYKDYHTIRYFDYSGSLKAIVAAMEMCGINIGTNASFDEMLNAKKTILHSADEHTLIIVDNYDRPDEYIHAFLPRGNSSYKVIFTSSNDSSIEAEYSYNLQALSYEACTEMLIDSDLMTEEDEEAVENILKKCAYNPLAISMISNAICRSGIDMEACALLIAKQQSQYDEELMRLSCSNHSYMQLICNIKTALTICQLSDAEKEALKALTLIPQCGIPISDLISYCNSPGINTNVIMYLFNQGLVSLKEDLTKVSLHPAIRDYVSISDAFPLTESYHNLASALDCLLNPDTKGSFAEAIRCLPYMQTLENHYKNNCPAEKKAFLKAQLAQYYLYIDHIPEAYSIAKQLDRIINDARSQGNNIYDDYLCYYNCLAGLLCWKNKNYEKAIERFEIAHNVSTDIVEMFNRQFSDITVCTMLLSALCNCELTPAGSDEKANDDIAALDMVLCFANSNFKTDYIYYIAKKILEISDRDDQSAYSRISSYSKTNAYPRERYEKVMLYNKESPIKDMSPIELLDIVKAFTLLILSLHKAKNALYLESNRCYDQAIIIANRLYGGFLTQNMIFNYHYYMACHLLRNQSYTLASENLQKMIEIDVKTAGRLIRNEYLELKSNDSHKTMHGLIILKYMALAYEHVGNVVRCLDVYDTFFEIYPEETTDLDGRLRLDAICCCVKHNLSLGKKEKALELINKESNAIARRFGEYSINRAELLINAGELLHLNGCKEFTDYLNMAKAIIDQLGYDKETTVMQRISHLLSV